MKRPDGIVIGRCNRMIGGLCTGARRPCRIIGRDIGRIERLGEDCGLGGGRGGGVGVGVGVMGGWDCIERC